MNTSHGGFAASGTLAVNLVGGPGMTACDARTHGD